MKKMTAILLILALTLAGCSSQSTIPAATVASTEPSVSDTIETAPAEDSEAAEAETGPRLFFHTTDQEGNPWTEQVFAEHKLTILNFWEPWCGPCVGEMPDLQRIYEEYASQGLLILGIYATQGVEEEVQQVLTDTGVTYPILNYSSDFDFLQTGYVPTTIFIDETGQILFQPFSGSLGYDDWVQIVEALL